MQSAPAEHHFSPSSNPPESNGVSSAQNNPLSPTPTIFPSLPPPNEFFALNNANGIGQNSHVKPHHQPMSIMTPTPWRPIPLQPLTSAHHHHHRGMDNAPRPHPHITSSTLFISHVPPDVPEEYIAKALEDCMPVRINLKHQVDPNHRLKPDEYYDWMPRAGILQFDSMYNGQLQTWWKKLEKALTILPEHPYIAQRGIIISPYPAPQLLPLPDQIVPARYLRPSALVHPPSEPLPADATLKFMAQCPSSAQLYDSIRPWGSLRQLSVWAQEEELPPGTEGQARLLWRARVEFWYEDEAKMFEIGFGQTGSIIKGWQVHITADSFKPTFNVSAPPAPAIGPPSMPFPALLDTFQIVPPKLDSQAQLPMLLLGPGAHPAAPAAGIPHLGFAGVLPPTPPALSYTPPWAAHNIFAALPSPMTPVTPLFPDMTGRHIRTESGPMPMSREGTPTTPNFARAALGRRSVGSFRGGSHARQRTWSVTVENSPEGELRTTGLVADDGTYIQHGPGQHIRPAPAYGPGANSLSGLVDYSNVFVKGLDPDINSYFLSDLFEHLGRIVSARVMRDEQGRSRGYGFVSFQTPEEAAHAINVMNNTKVGKQIISVTLHEPRKLRPEKIAERIAQGVPMGFGRNGSGLGTRRSSSPIRTDRRGRNPVPVDDGQPALGTTDEIRLLSPDARKASLRRRVAARVRTYAKTRSIPDRYVEPTIKALVALDLSLVPLLHDPDQLQAKITETLSVLQGDPELDINLGVQSSQPSPVKDVDAISEDPEELRGRLHEEIARIDPMEVDEVLVIMLPMLSHAEISHCLSNKNFLAAKYNVAKKELIKQQATASKDVALSSSPPLEATSSPISSDISSETASPPPLSHSVKPPVIDDFIRVSPETVNLPFLASLGIRDIMANISGEDGEAILSKVECSRPTATEAASLARWTKGVMEKTGVERKAEIAGMLAKKMDAAIAKRSAKLKVAKALVSQEDDEAVCKLMAYPALLDAKVKSHLAGSASSSR